MSQPPSVIAGRVRAGNDLRKGEVRRSTTAPLPPRTLRFTCLMCQQKAAGWLCSKHLGPSTLSE